MLSRSEVKSLRDGDAHRIAFDTPIATTVSALNNIPSHCGPARNHRTRIEERQVYTVTARITRIKRERDHDVHIVLADLDHPRDRLVVEADDPDFRKNAASPYREKLAAGRRMLDALIAQAGARQLRDLQGTIVRVTGVGFFDVRHFQVGRSRNCIELHPVLAIERGGSLRSPQGPLRLAPSR
jgi:hypothetical protein